VATLRVGDGPVDLGELAELHQAVERESPIPAPKLPLSARSGIDNHVTLTFIVNP
jgi:hypothetical protein